ncbi:E3 ubiquitin-protein ligase march6 [Clonorchis sinensis]|uniref:RING-type E3 ubiquitin transferase n=1 Tax=Clonorchis sinensis TaxID=79923 RepID=A0A8T1M6L6_CLOSI|nr:E3 ubiquitin-protein ligase march6 [Clonorchis sinensis]
MTSEDPNHGDFCRVCRCESTPLRPLFYPCMCTGSIKYIHQDCLVRWLQYSKRHTCELCNHRFKFAPIYASGTPRFVPPRVLLVGLINSVRRSVIGWLHLLLVCVAWLVVVPLTACRIYRCLFTGSVSSLLALPLNMLSTQHLLWDCLQGLAIVILALAAFLGYISLREQLLQGGAPAWLEQTLAGENGAAEGNERRQFFPDLLNLFGAANGVGFAVDELPDEPVEPANVPDISENRTNNTSSDNSPRPSSSTSLATETSHDTRPSEVSNPNQTAPALPMQPQNSGWTATGFSEDEGDAEADEDVNDEAEGDAAADGAADDAALGEAMNWDRLLGLDGSLAFLEHVLWLIALNTLFVVIFAFCPYHVGQFTVLGFKLDNLITATHMEGLTTSLVGYLIIAGFLISLHCVLKLFGLQRPSYWFGLGYVYLKVALISLFEVGIFPILCGFWIDACTLSLFNASLANRVSVFHYAPVAFTFIHWAVGMLYVFYMASLLLLTRSVVRPGVLRFVRLFNDADYKPIHDMIMQPLHIYTQRLIATFSAWGILIVFMLWVPIEAVRRVLPGFLPFQLAVAHENPLDYSVEIILVQVVLPFLLDVQAKAAVRQFLRLWCICVGVILGMRSYLVGDVPFKPGDWIVNEDGSETPFISSGSPSGSGQSASSQSNARRSSSPLATRGTPVPAAEDPMNGQPEPEPAGPQAPDDRDDMGDAFPRYVPYKRPRLFRLRLVALCFVVVFSLMLLSSALLIVPVAIGRLTFALFSTRTNPRHDAVALVTGVTVLGLLFRLSLCLPVFLTALRRSFCILAARLSRLLCWSRPLRVLRIWTRSGTTCEIAIPRPALPPPMSSLRNTNNRGEEGEEPITLKLIHTLIFLFGLVQMVAIIVLFLVILPVCLGLLINLTFIAPFQVGPRKTLYIGFWEHWIFGIMHLKVGILLTLVGPTWWLRRRLEACQNELLQNRYRARAFRLLSELAPLLVCVGSGLTVPYLLAHYTAHRIGLEMEFTLRFIYPALFALIVLLVLGLLEIRHLQTLYTRIKDEKYLVGRRLVNFGSTAPADKPIAAIERQ